MNTHSPQLPSQQPTANDSFDYKSKLIKIDATIDLLKCSWPSHITLHHDPCNLTCPILYHHSSHLPPAILSTNDDSFDFKSQLNENNAAIEWLQ